MLLEVIPSMYEHIYAMTYDICKYEEGTPLTVSHRINKKKAVRYDFMFLKPEKINVKETNYLYEAAIEASADHALLLVEGSMNE